MNTIMILSNLKHERLDKALECKQGLVLTYTFLRKQNHRIMASAVMNQGL